jgi:hypothetical protein
MRHRLRVEPKKATGNRVVCDCVVRDNDYSKWAAALTHGTSTPADFDSVTHDEIGIANFQKIRESVVTNPIATKISVLRPLQAVTEQCDRAAQSPEFHGIP